MKKNNIGVQVQLLQQMRGKPQERALMQLPECLRSDMKKKLREPPMATVMISLLHLWQRRGASKIDGRRELLPFKKHLHYGDGDGDGNWGDGDGDGVTLTKFSE